MGAAETERNPQRAAGAGPGENGRPQTESRQAGQRSGRDEALRRQAAAGVLAQDPRPSYQRDPERIYGMEFAGWEIRFQVRGERLTVVEVKEKG